MKKEGRSLWAPSANRTRWWFEEKPARAAPPVRTKTTFYSVLHVRLESKSHEKLFVLVMCDVALQCHSET